MSDLKDFKKSGTCSFRHKVMINYVVMICDMSGVFHIDMNMQ